MTMFSGGRRIDLAPGDAVYSQIGAGVAEAPPLGKRLHRINPDLDNGHDPTPIPSFGIPKNRMPIAARRGI